MKINECILMSSFLFYSSSSVKIMNRLKVKNVDKRVTHDIQLPILSIFVTLIFATVEGTHHPYIRSVCDVRPQHNTQKFKAAALRVYTSCFFYCNN
jgi:hypothetical protein